ncbi:hypothetical protein V496_00606 [Pseudogymnoascus sp. VKM F-4515 (FW-2607)]|nr:hypothetical protein V496_00606 [Pseudogymnoascus sp. VKM F-4515 (FW-2607)]
MADAPNESSAIPVATVEMETAQNEPTAGTTQQTTTDKQHSASSLHLTPSSEATTEAASHPRPNIPSTDILISDALMSTLSSVGPEEIARPQFPPYLHQHLHNPQAGRAPTVELCSQGFISSASSRPYVAPYPTPPTVTPTHTPTLTRATPTSKPAPACAPLSPLMTA